MSPNFLSLEQLDDENYEVIVEKQTAIENLPVHLGTRYMHFQMLMLMHMLVFIHDFLGNMLDDKKWEILGGDTDNVIIALAEKSVDASVLPENGQNLKN